MAAGLRRGDVIGSSYRIHELIGRGWAGTVYRAEHSMMGRPTALKIITTRAVSDPTFIERFRKAVELLSQIESPQIAMVHDLGVEPPNQVYIASELVEGKSLARILAEEGPMAAQRLLDVIRAVLVGLKSIHDINGVHGSVKPANVIIADGGLPKIVDFGALRIVQAARDESFTTVTSYGAVFGELAYLAPEQITGGTVDARSDIYALGLLMYEMLTGARAFRQDNASELAKAQVEAQPVPPRVFKPQLKIPKFIERAIMQALQKNPAQRQKSVGVMLEQLEAEIVPEAAPPSAVKEAVIVPDEDSSPVVLMPDEGGPQSFAQTIAQITGRTVVAPRPPKKAEAPRPVPKEKAPSEPSGPRLVLYEGKKVVSVFPLAKQEMLVGRSPDCDIMLDNPTVSRVHARVLTKPSRFVVEDLDSLNGTYINDEAIKRGHIEDNDAVAFGNMTFTFRTA